MILSIDDRYVLPKKQSTGSQRCMQILGGNNQKNLFPLTVIGQVTEFTLDGIIALRLVCYQDFRQKLFIMDVTVVRHLSDGSDCIGRKRNLQTCAPIREQMP